MAPHIGYVRITEFTATTGSELGQMIDKLVADKAEKLIVDLPTPDTLECESTYPNNPVTREYETAEMLSPLLVGVGLAFMVKSSCAAIYAFAALISPMIFDVTYACTVDSA